MIVERAEKRCIECGEVKALSQFYRNKSGRDGYKARCKTCHRRSSDAARARRRAELGEDAYLAEHRAAVGRYRQRNPGAAAKAAKPRAEALKALVARHRREYEHLLLLARRGELSAPSTEEVER